MNQSHILLLFSRADLPNHLYWWKINNTWVIRKINCAEFSQQNLWFAVLWFISPRQIQIASIHGGSIKICTNKMKNMNQIQASQMVLVQWLWPLWLWCSTGTVSFALKRIHFVQRNSSPGYQPSNPKYIYIVENTSRTIKLNSMYISWMRHWERELIFMMLYARA